jgi:hypothetical protein
MNRKLSKTLSSFALAYLLTSSTFSLAEEDYLFELLEHPQYLRTWNDLISSQKNVAHWLSEYSKTKNGPTTPGVIVHTDGNEYRINFVCKTHDCGNNMFYVMFSADGQDAWGLLLSDQHEDIFFGSPDKEKEDLLKTAANL